MAKKSAFITLSMGFDPATMHMLHGLEDFDALLAAHLIEAHTLSLDELEQAAQASMMASFQNPTGKAETAFRKRVSSPYRSILGNYLPYVQRLNYGFSGQTDSLGRYFSAWPASQPEGYHWAEKAIEMATPYVYQHFYDAVRGATDAVI